MPGTNKESFYKQSVIFLWIFMLHAVAYLLVSKSNPVFSKKDLL